MQPLPFTPVDHTYSSNEFQLTLSQMGSTAGAAGGSYQVIDRLTFLR